MSESDLKLRIIRLVDSQQGEVLQELYSLILNKLSGHIEEEVPIPSLEMGYHEMAQDVEREDEAFEWIEGTLNQDSL